METIRKQLYNHISQDVVDNIVLEYLRDDNLGTIHLRHTNDHIVEPIVRTRQRKKLSWIQKLLKVMNK